MTAPTTRQLGDTLRNRCTIIAITELNADEAIVLAITNGQSGHPYATWVMRLSGGETFQGEYLFTMTDAFASYTARGGK